MKNKKKLGIFSFIICLLTTVFVFSLNKTFAETPEVSVTGKFVDTITNVKVSNDKGELKQWETFRLYADFDLSGKDVKAGDQTTITVSDALMINSDDIEIRDKDTNEVIAHAKLSADNKSITLTYTDFAEKHSDTHGFFFFYARVDFKKHPQQGEIPVEITINKETKPVGKVSFTGVGDGNPSLLSKTSWLNENDRKELQYTISVNRTKQNIKGVTIEDHLKFTNASYEKDSIKVIKGKFSYETGEWLFSDRVDVTDQHKITVSEDGQSFVIELGDMTEEDQYRISYKVRLNYEPVDGELLKNDATLKGKDIESKDITNAALVQIAGGAGVGYVYSINIHKVDEANQPLKGAKFKVVRQANNQVIGEFVSDDNGNIAVNELLKDKYIITEVEAPSGYVIKVADTEVNVEDFGAERSATKTIVNPKEETTTTTTTTTSTTTTTTTTTTEEPTTTSTTTTTTEEPTTTSTTTTTTEEPKTTSSTTTTTEEPTTTSTTTTTTEEPKTTSTTTTTTEEPKTTSSTTTTTEEPKTTSSTTTTTEEPKTTSSTTTTTGESKTTSSTTTTTEEPKSTVTTTKDKPGLPKTGENKGTFVTILGTLILVSSILVVRNSLKSKNN